MSSPLAAVIKREYLERVRTKAFWISTALVPIFMAGIFLLPLALFKRVGGDFKLVVIDETGQLYDDFARRMEERREDDEFGRFVWKLERRDAAPAGSPARQSLRERVRKGDVHAYLALGPRALEGETIEYVAKNVSNLIAIEKIHNSLNGAIIAARLRTYGVPDSSIDSILRRTALEPIPVDDTEGKKDAGGAYMTAIFLFLVQYMTVIMYGIYVMRGVLEEKTSRVVEIMLSSMKPFPLMFGKILGIGAVGLTQYALWTAVAALFSLPGVSTALATGLDAPLPSFKATHIVFFVVFFVLAYFLYSTLYAAVGAAFNSEQDAQQFQAVITVFLVVPALLMGYVLEDPSSNLSVALSLFPMFTPSLMYLRILVQTPPVWQIALGITLVVAAILLMTWISARIYRIGILMYGKKPTIPEILRWIRYT